MARTNIRRYTTTSTGRYGNTYTSKPTSYNSHYYSSYYSDDGSSAQIAVGVIFGLYAFGLIIAAIVYFQRQKKRKALYSQMAAYYRNGGLPPCVAATAGVGDKAQLSPNNPPTQSSYPKAQYENPARFGPYGNPPTVPHTTVTDVTDETGTLPLSSQPQQSQFSNTAISNAAPTVRHSIVYARPLSTPTQTDPPLSPIHGTPAHYGGALPNTQTYATQTGSLSSPTHGAHPFYRGGQANTVTYNAAPKRPENAEASGPAQGPAFSGGPHREAEHVAASGSAQAPPYTGEPYNANDSPPKEPEYAKASGSSQAPAYTAGPYSANDLPAKEPKYADASGSTPAPAYSGGPSSTNEYPKGKDQE